MEGTVLVLKSRKYLLSNHSRRSSDFDRFCKNVLRHLGRILFNQARRSTCLLLAGVEARANCSERFEAFMDTFFKGYASLNVCHNSLSPWAKS